MRAHTAPWPPGQLTTSELANERAELERKLGDDAFATPEARERWCKRLGAIKQEQLDREAAEQRSRTGLTTQ